MVYASPKEEEDEEEEGKKWNKIRGGDKTCERVIPVIKIQLMK